MTLDILQTSDSRLNWLAYPLDFPQLSSADISLNSALLSLSFRNSRDTGTRPPFPSGRGGCLFILFNHLSLRRYTMSTSKPVSAAQINRINALLDRNLISIDVMPTESWEASCIIRNSPASVRDKTELKNKGGRVLARMTCGELELSTKVVDALKLLEVVKSKDSKLMDAVTLLRAQFISTKPQ